MGIGGFGQGPAPVQLPTLLCFMSKESTLHRYEVFELSIYSSRVASRFGISAEPSLDGFWWKGEFTLDPGTSSYPKRKGSWEEDFPLL